jgi:hypothetical protein
MSSPSPRQQAGYLRRLLRRGEIEVIDPATGRAAPVMVELHGTVIRLVPMLESAKTETRVTELSFDDDAPLWASLLARLRRAVTLAQAEELTAAVESELGRAGRVEPPV